MIAPMVFLAVGIALGPGAVIAQVDPPRAPGQSAFTALDADRDGSISRIEAAALPSLNTQFTLMDQNRNGALEPAEFARFEMLDPGDRDTRTPPPLGSTPPPEGSTPPPDGSMPPP
ncbi:MAG: hypothetical protein ACRES8_06810, partial [Nevskiaceae bacterium]